MCSGQKRNDISISRGTQLTSLKGIENLTKLKKLEVGKNRLKNLKGIEKLTNLEEQYKAMLSAIIKMLGAAEYLWNPNKKSPKQ